MTPLERPGVPTLGRISDGIEVPSSERFDALVCQAGNDRVALVLTAVDEVVPVATMLEVPESPPWVCGLLDLRGHIIPVLDVLARLTRTRRPVALSDHFVICQDGDRRVGLVVHSVHSVSVVTRSSISSVPTMGAVELQGSCLLGVAHADGEMTLLLSISRLVGTDRPGDPTTAGSTAHSFGDRLPGAALTEVEPTIEEPEVQRRGA